MEHTTEIKLVNQNSIPILKNLLQAYEAEFSIITKKSPGQDGLYPLDVDLNKDCDSFLLYLSDIPIGFAIKGITENRHDILEFYIIPTQRGNQTGRKFAHELFRKYKGNWQVRQIENAYKARNFWRATINDFSDGAFSETEIKDPYWGNVTRQLFSSKI